MSECDARKSRRLRLWRQQELAEKALKVAQHEYLIGSGWRWSCQTTGSVWLYVKTVNGIRWGMNIHDAVIAQETIDAERGLFDAEGANDY